MSIDEFDDEDYCDDCDELVEECYCDDPEDDCEDCGEIGCFGACDSDDLEMDDDEYDDSDDSLDHSPDQEEIKRLLSKQKFNVLDQITGVDNLDLAAERGLILIKSTPERLVSESRRLQNFLERRLGIEIEPMTAALGPSIQGHYDPANGSAVIALAGVNDSLL